MNFYFYRGSNMMYFALAAVPFVMKVIMGIWVFAALVLVFVVLIQKGRGGGLSAAFGGLGSSLLGTKTGDFLTWVTICIVAVWLLLSISAAKWFKPYASEYLQSERMPPAPVTAPAPAVPVEAEKPLQSQQPAENQKSETGQTGAETREPNMPAGIK
jgi:preprotein translocase subunit SecG